MRRSASATRPKSDERHHRQHRDGGEHPRRLQLGVVLTGSGGRGRSSAPAHSPKTAPITATATAILAPLKKKGSAVGASTRRRICQRRASSVRIILITSGSTERRPSSVLTVIGKKQTSAIDRQLRADPEAEPDDQDRRDRRRSGSSGRRPAAGRRRAAGSRRGAGRPRSARPAASAQSEAEQDLLQRHPGVFGEQRAVLPERGRRFRAGEGTRKSSRLRASAIAPAARGELPGAEQDQDHRERRQVRGGASASSRRPPRRAAQRPLAGGDERADR